MGLITFPGSFPSAFPATAERQYRKSAPFWYDPVTGRRGDRITWWIPREDVGDALTWVGGQAELVPSSWGSIYRVVRMRNPDDEGQYAVKAEIEWRGNSFDGDMYSSALLTVDFATPEYEDTGDTPYADINTDYSAQGITLPGRYLRIESSGECLHRDDFKAIGSASYVLTAYKCPSLNPAIIAPCLENPVNSAPFYLPRFGTVDPGYALLRTYKEGAKFSLGGLPSIDVSYHIDIRFGLTWQQTIHRGAVETVTHPDGSYLYGTSDLNVLMTA
jgi:hypothetical protein